MGRALPDRSLEAGVGTVAHGTFEKYREAMLLSSRPLLDTRADRRLFVGRTSQLAALDRARRAGLNTLVLGDRGSGSTSLLRQVALRLREERCHRVELVDAGPTDGAEELLTLLVERLLPTGSPPHLPGPRPGLSEGGRLLALLDRLRRELPAVLDHPPVDADKGPAWEAGRPVVVLLDNASPAAAHVLLGRLRDETWSLPVVWVVAADRSAAAGFLEPPADTFFEARVVLDELSVDEAVALLRARVAAAKRAAPGGRVPNELLRRIVDGVPVRTPRALVSALRDVVGAASEAGVSAAGAGTSPTLAAVDLVTGQQRERAGRLAHLGRSAAMLVAELQSRGGSASASDDGLLDALGWTRSRASQVFRQLEAADLVTASERRVNGAGRPRKVYELVGRVR